MKAVMYHYVQEFNKKYPYLKFLDFENFQKQLDYFGEMYGFTKKEEFLKSLDTGIPADGVILTFDDSLKCHYRYVYPELKKRGLWGIFYIPTSIYTEAELLEVHKIHLLLSRVKPEDVLEQLHLFIDEADLPDKKREEYRTKTYLNYKKSRLEKEVKRILNFYLDYSKRSKIFTKLFSHFDINQDASASDYYMTPAEFKEMHCNGMMIGSHTVSHPVMSKLSGKEQETEIKESFSFLENIVGELNPKTFCYPYGGFASFNDETERILEAESCRFAFNVEPREIQSDDLINRKQALPRFDCNQFQFGECYDFNQHSKQLQV